MILQDLFLATGKLRGFWCAADCSPTQHLALAHPSRADALGILWPSFVFLFQSLDESTKIMIVRHPFERLLSAYRDKLEDHQRGPQHGTFHYYRKYGRKIVSKYRQSNSSRVEPSFEEFIDYLIDTDLALYADDHWIPFYLFCTPCLVDYDLIVRFETLGEDLLLLLRRLGLEERPSWKHMTLGGTSSQVAQSYFQQLGKTKVQQLFQKYKMDFRLFGYDVDPYLAIARDDVKILWDSLRFFEILWDSLRWNCWTTSSMINGT